RPALRHRGRHGQAARRASRLGQRRQRAPGPRRQRLCRGVRDQPRPVRRPHPQHLRGRRRDPGPGHRARTLGTAELSVEACGLLPRASARAGRAGRPATGMTFILEWYRVPFETLFKNRRAGRKHMRTLQRTLAAVATATLVMFGTMGGALAQTKVTLHLDWLINGFYAPFFTALEKGWYKEAGLDVKIVPGKGSFDAVRSVGAGNAEFGFANSTVMVKAAADGLPVLAVAVLVQDWIGGIASLGEPGIQKPKDLEGKTLGIVPEEAVARLLPAFFKINSVDPNKVKIVNYTFATKDPSLLAGKVDSVGGYIIGEYLNAKKGAGDRKVNWL